MSESAYEDSSAALAWPLAWTRDGRVRGALVVVLVFGFLAAVQFSSPNLAGTDGYYHIRLAYLMRTEGLKPEFDWLPLTILNQQEFVNHHFLFHVALMPFTYGDLVVGAKWASVVFGTVALLGLWWTLDRQGIRYAAAWTLLALAVSEAFIYRLSMPRAQSLSLGVLTVGMHWALTGRARLLLPLAAAYVWLYDAFPLLLLVAGAYALARWLTTREVRLGPLGYAGLGSVLGLITHPYFPRNLVFLGKHLLPKLSGATSINVGNEWFPYSTAQLIENSGLALLLFGSGVLALGLARRRMQLRTAMALILTLSFGLMLLEARRFIEYFPAFVVIFAACAWAPLIDAATGAFADRPHGLRTALALSPLVLLLWSGARATLHSLDGTASRDRYRGAASWLAGNTPSGARVFQTDWDDFPRLFFHNTHNTYLVGLDPSYLQLKDPTLYDHWVELTHGESDDLSVEILHDFGAEYVFTDLKHTDFLRAAAEDPQMRQVYRDAEAAVFAVSDA